MKKKLKVAVLLDAWFPFCGGGQVHVRELTKRLDQSCEFTIYHSKSSHIASRFLWAIYVILLTYLDHQKTKFDLIHAHAYISGLPAKILSLLLKIPVIYTVHGSNSMDLKVLTRKKPHAKYKLYLAKYYLEKWLLTGIKYDRQISVSSNFCNYQNVNKNISVIPNGIDIQEFDKIKVKKRKHFTIIFVGRDVPIKGLFYLHKAVKLVKIKYPHVDLLTITGGIANKNKIIRLYKSSHLFALPSLSEGQPITLLEAWAAKLPVLVSRVGHNPKMVKEGINGFLFPPADVKTLEKKIEKAINHPELAKLGRAGYNLVRKRYSWDKAAKATLKVYKEVIRGTRQTTTYNSCMS